MPNSVIQRLFKIVFKTVESLAPPLAGRWAIKLFFTPFEYPRPRRERKYIKNASIQKIPRLESYDTSVTEPYFVMYRWGEGPTILLVHGWAGRGSQVASLAGPLVQAGYRVITFDAPAHGASPGQQTNILEFNQTIKQIETMVGPYEAIIGHSFGGVAGALAMSEGVQANKLVTIGSPATMDFVFQEFNQQINASGKTTQQVIQYIEQVTQHPIEDFSLVNLAPRLHQPGLIIHDKQDKEVHHSQALLLAEQWPNSQLVLTEGLGHTRILRDPQIIAQIVNFVQAEVNVA